MRKDGRDLDGWLYAIEKLKLQSREILATAKKFKDLIFIYRDNDGEN